MDECRRGEHSCHDKAICSDVIGADDSYNCTCESGYTGDGYSCLSEPNIAQHSSWYNIIYMEIGTELWSIMWVTHHDDILM